MVEPIEIDGSTGEGGGQILRSSLSLSALTARPVHVHSIRASRKRPGLAAQHLTCVEAMAEVCDADVKGASRGSGEITFVPEEVQPGRYRWNIETAGAAPLVVQTVLPVLCFAGDQSHIEVQGGTHVQNSPTADYLAYLYGPILRRLGLRQDISIDRYGFYPKGGGLLTVRVDPRGEEADQINSVDWGDRRSFEQVQVRSVATEDLQDRRVAERQVDGVRSIFGRKVSRKDARYVSSPSTGTAVFVRPASSAPVPGAVALGERGKPSEEVGQEAASKLKPLMNQGLPLDRWMADQVLIPTVETVNQARLFVPAVSSHLETNINIIKKFYDGIDIQYQFKAGERAVIHIEKS